MNEQSKLITEHEKRISALEQALEQSEAQRKKDNTDMEAKFLAIKRELEKLKPDPYRQGNPSRP
jgi:hypothetical protein